MLPIGRCLYCDSPLEETEAFEILAHERTEFFESFCQPLHCPECGRHFAVDNGLPVYEVTETGDPYRTYNYILRGKDIVFTANLWPEPETLGAVFRLEDLAERPGGPVVQLDDIEIDLAESDLEFFRPTLDALRVCRSSGLIGEAQIHANLPIRGGFGLCTEGSELYYHELCRRIFAFYERNKPVSTADLRIYGLIWKAMERIYKRYLGRTRHAFKTITDLTFLERARDCTVEHFGSRMILTATKVRTMRALIEHCALAYAADLTQAQSEAQE